MTTPKPKKPQPVMKVNPILQEMIDQKVLAEREDKTPSGRMAAGKLSWPLQWKMLHYYKVPQPPVDEFTMRKFQRGTDVENRIVEWINPEKKQEFVVYREVVGYVDMILNEVPFEIKSVTNMAFKYIQKGGPKWGHKMQAMLYAKALGQDTFNVAYVASDDYRILCFEEKVTDEVDKLIDEYEAQVEIGTVPVFAAKEEWHSKKDYSSYPDWMDLTEEQIAKKLADHMETYGN